MAIKKNLPAKPQDKEKPSPLTDKQLALIDNLSKYPTWYEAAKASDYAESTSKNIKQIMTRYPAFMEQLRDKYMNNSTLALVDIGLIEENVLNHCKQKGNVGDVPKHVPMLKQIKQSAGVLKDDHVSKTTTINIQSIEKVQVAIGDMLRTRMIPVACEDEEA